VAAPPADWNVLPHTGIEKLTENLWRVEGELEGLPLKRVSTIARRASGTLVIHNPIALGEPLMAEIEAWGGIHEIIVPNGYHRIDAPRFKRRYPAAKVYCPRAAQSRVGKVVPVDGAYADFPAEDGIRIDDLEGMGGTEGVMTVRSKDGTTLVFNDAIFNMPHVPGFHGWVFRNITNSSGGPRVSRLARLALVKDKGALRSHLERLADTPSLKRVIVSHHELIQDEPREAIRRAAATL
jgi:hypothetical protein